MQALLRIYLTLGLALAVALASIGHVQARHQVHGATTMVICTGYGLVQITLDLDGEPVELTLPCPDCTLTATPLLPADTGAVGLQSLVGQVALTPHVATFHPAAAGFWHQSRAPPRPA